MFKKAIGVLLAIVGIVTFTFLGGCFTLGVAILLALPYNMLFGPDGGPGILHSDSLLMVALTHLLLIFSMSGPVFGLIGGIRWAKGLFED